MPIPPTGTPIPSPTFQDVPAGQVQVPILLYHHIAAPPDGKDPYYLSPEQFLAQMQRLKDWDYTPILVSNLAAVLRSGGKLPQRPIVISFDDGNRDVYENAYPILKSLNFPAVMYVIVSGLNASTNLTTDMLRELVSAGWEIGSHSYTHPNLIKTLDLQKEICQSRRDLAKATGTAVNSFAYPYGLADAYVTHYALDCGYTSAVGLGPSTLQNLKNVYYLNRMAVLDNWSLDDFTAYLPWKSP